MAQRECARCHELMEAPPEWHRVQILRGETGDLYVLDIEAPIHRCPTLTSEEAAELLRLAGEILAWPTDPPK